MKTDKPEYQDLRERLGSDALNLRLEREQKLRDQAELTQGAWFHRENFYGLHSVLKGFLYATGLRRRGEQNFQRVELHHHTASIPKLPRSFDGFAILHLSDLHLDGDLDQAAAVCDAISQISQPYDICVLTGDYRYTTHADPQECLLQMERIVSVLPVPCYAVLGNHDSIEMVPSLESMGVRVLLNEAISLQRGADELHLVGVDDPHHYRAHDFERAMRGVPADACTVLLAHSPEVYRQAHSYEISLVLCGHTHGGQICLPGGFPIIMNARCPRKYVRGAWSYNGLVGYTSIGTGGSGVSVRFGCTAELTLHQLIHGTGDTSQ